MYSPFPCDDPYARHYEFVLAQPAGYLEGRLWPIHRDENPWQHLRKIDEEIDSDYRQHEMQNAAVLG